MSQRTLFMRHAHRRHIQAAWNPLQGHRTRAIAWFSTLIAVSCCVLHPSSFAAGTTENKSADATPPTSLEAIHSKAQIARDRGNFDAVEDLRLERLKAIDSLPELSAWKQGIDAIKRSDRAIQQMRYAEAVETLLKAWQPFEAAHDDNPKAILFGDIAMKVFEAVQAALAVYEPSDQSAFPKLQDAELERLVNTAYESDPCQVELRAVRAFLTPPDADETFLPQARRKSITRRNEDLLAIAYPGDKTVPIRPWHGPAQFLLGKSSSYVMRDLRFLRYLDPDTRIRGRDRVGEVFHLVYGGAVLCYGVSAKEREETGRSTVRFFVDVYRDGSWHRLRPYFLMVTPSDDEAKKKRADDWRLLSTDVQRRVNEFEGQLRASELRLARAAGNAGGDQRPNAFQPPVNVTDANVSDSLLPIVNRFPKKDRIQLQAATDQIIAGRWTLEARDGSKPPPPGASLHDRLIFLSKCFRGLAQIQPKLAKLAIEASQDIEAIATSLPKPADPALGKLDGDGLEPLPPPGDDIQTALTPASALKLLKSVPELREAWEKRLAAVHDSGSGESIIGDPESIIGDYQLMIACRVLEQCLYIRKQAIKDDADNAAYANRDADFEKLFGKNYSVAVSETAPPPGEATNQQAIQDIEASLHLLECTDVIASLRQDLKELKSSQSQSPLQSPLQLTDQVRKDALESLNAAEALFGERARQLRSRDLEDITVDRPLYRQWHTPTAQWSLYEIPHTISPSRIADFLDNPLIPTFGLAEGSLPNPVAANKQHRPADVAPTTTVALSERTTLAKGTPLIRRKKTGDKLTLELNLAIAGDILPLPAVVLVEHALDAGEGGSAFDEGGTLHAETPEPHELVHDRDELKSVFDGCDGFIPATFGAHARRLVDRRGNTITQRRLDEPTPFTVVSATKQDISDGGDNVVYSWDAWRDLDQNIVNDFLPSTQFYSPSPVSWMTYRQELLRPTPAWPFKWGAARASYYRRELKQAPAGAGHDAL